MHFGYSKVDAWVKNLEAATPFRRYWPGEQRRDAAATFYTRIDFRKQAFESRTAFFCFRRRKFVVQL
jgi:hypothetical protein